MKWILGAFALVIAAPAVAQGAPVTGPAAGHPDHQQHGGEHPAGHAGAGEQMMDCCRDCCDKMKQQDKPMKCCDEHGDAASGAPASEQQHHH